jgi:hypothetical protein
MTRGTGGGWAGLPAMGALLLAALTPVLVLTGAQPAPGMVAGELGHPSDAGASPLSWADPAAFLRAPAAPAAIHPGVRTETQGGGRCTANFVFAAEERRFLGQAAHCAGTGEATETDGCASGTRPLGTPVSIEAADGTRRAGRLAYSSWITMQSRGETDPAACAYNDFALVELTARDAAEASPNLPGLGGPTGLRTDGPPPGARVFGYAGGGAGLLAKVGVHAHAVGAGFGHEIYTSSPGVPGESGSAFVDADGAAFGVLTTLNLSTRPVSNGVTDLGAALAYANEHGGLGRIALALGTEPFHATAD